MTRPALLVRWPRGKRPVQPLAVGVVTRPHFAMDRALLCVECESLYEAVESQTCPACGGRQALALGRVMGERRAG